ncbi:hypothetical protein ACTI_13750 [Actinoplanes sp. OR16]|uniref:hypothetical protein n=1 Tax=Actinoplanes sp. OR16 TaxID=946334 RepID=UPI000F6ED548|nr:hypothetical protein [Actinoplanes sp. OR16]BBH64690.1 hypothetical protein ACTI_13750 [Actinoplanes sp. OR16]
MTAPTTEPEPEVAPVPTGREPWAGWETVIRAGGVIVAVLATLVTAFAELELTTLRSGGVANIFTGGSPWEGGGVLVPIAIPVAIAANLVIAWFAVTSTGRRWALGPPWALWTLIMLAAAGTRTAEGDYLLSGDNWVALVMILLGSLTFAVYSYRMILKPIKTADSQPASRNPRAPSV